MPLMPDMDDTASKLYSTLITSGNWASLPIEAGRLSLSNLVPGMSMQTNRKATS